MTYASFWKRVAACLVDIVLYSILMSIPLLFISVHIKAGEDPSATMKAFFIWRLLPLSLTLYLLYYVWPESSSWQATPGKKLFNLKVSDENGQRISFWRSLGRNAGILLSYFIFYVGFFECLMCLWTQKKQCLHDMITGGVVEDTTPDKRKLLTVMVWILFLLVSVVAP